jgi:Lrp/AsnC family leucine-responsive transcriptional regulator
MDLIDTRILEALNENGRATASEISRRVYLPILAVLERNRKMEGSHNIKQFSVSSLHI